MRKIAMSIGLAGLAACAPYGPVSVSGNIEAEVLAVYGGDGPLQQGGTRNNAWQTVKIVDRFSGDIAYSVGWADRTRVVALYLCLGGDNELRTGGFSDGVERSGTVHARYRIDNGEIANLTLEYGGEGGAINDYEQLAELIDDLAAGGTEMEVQIGQEAPFKVHLEGAQAAIGYATTLCDEEAS